MIITGMIFYLPSLTPLLFYNSSLSRKIPLHHSDILPLHVRAFFLALKQEGDVSHYPCIFCLGDLARAHPRAQTDVPVEARLAGVCLDFELAKHSVPAA